MSKQVLVLVLLCVYASAQKARQLGHFKVDWPASTNLYENKDAQSAPDRWTLLISSYSSVPLTQDKCLIIRSVGSTLKSLNETNTDVLTTSTTWPNEVAQVPLSVFGKEAVSIADGFLSIVNEIGSIKIVDVSGATPSTVDITTERFELHDWFYHRVIWMDMNGDGRPDAVTARARRPLFGNPVTEFLWFEQPNSMPLSSGPWKHHKIDNGACTHLRHAKLKAGNKEMDVIVTVGYWTKKIQIYWTADPNGLWTSSSMIRSVAVDDTPSNYYDVVIDDVNKDGRQDILVTSKRDDNGTVVVYEVPDDFRTGTFKPHLLADGFKARVGGGFFAQFIGAPGSAETFYPTRDTSGKPHIQVAGDDDGRAYILSPRSADPNNWLYDREVLLDAGSGNTIGKLTAGDVDGDGFTELFVPAYQQGKIHVFTYAPDSKTGGQLIG